jgi:hypothetical protein
MSIPKKNNAKLLSTTDEPFEGEDVQLEIWHLNPPIPCFVNMYKSGSLFDTVKLVHQAETISPPTVHAFSNTFNAMVKAPRNPTPAQMCNDAACLPPPFSCPSCPSWDKVY